MENYVGNEIELSILMNAMEETHYGNNRIFVISGEHGIGKTALLDQLRQKLSERKNNEKEIRDHFDVIENINALPDNIISETRNFCKGICSEKHAQVLMLVYTPTPDDNRSAEFVTLLQELKGSLDNDFSQVTFLEMKPLKLADVHFMVAGMYRNNDFESTFANKLHRYTKGNPLFVKEVLRYLTVRNIIKTNGGRYVLEPTDFFDQPRPIEYIEEKFLELLEGCQDIKDPFFEEQFAITAANYLEHCALSPESETRLARLAEKVLAAESTPIKRYAELIEIKYKTEHGEIPPQEEYLQPQAVSKMQDPHKAIELLAMLTAEYKMSQAISLANDIIKANKLEEDPHERYIIHYLANIYKCRALIFMGVYEEALQLSSEMLQMAQNSEDLHLAHSLIAEAEGHLFRYESCYQHFAKAREIAMELNDLEAVAEYLCHEVPFLLEFPKLDKVKENLEQARAINERIQNHRGICENIVYMAYYQRYMSHYDDAQQELPIALEGFKKYEDAKFMARTLNVMGLVYESKCDFEKAEKYYEKAVKTLQDINDQVGLIGIYENFGHLKFDVGDYEKSIEYQQKALSNAKSINSLLLMSSAYAGIGSAYIYLGKLDEAEQNMSEGLKIAEQLNNKSAIAYACSSLADVYFHRDNLDKALELYLRALQVDRELGDTPSVTCDLTNIANLYVARKDVDNGIHYLESVEAMETNSDNVILKATIANAFGNLYSEKGDIEKAREYYRKSLNINLEIGDKICVSLNYYNLGLLSFDQRQYEEAIKDFGKSVEYDRLTGDNLQLAQHLMRLAYCYRLIDKADKSRELNLEAAKLYKGLDIMDDYATALRAAGDDARALGENKQARKLLNDSLQIFRETCNHLEMAETMATLAVLETVSNNFNEAETLYAQALHIFKKYGIDNAERITKILQTQAWTFNEEGKAEEALKCYKTIADQYKDVDKDFYVENLLLAAKMSVATKDNNQAAEYYSQVKSMLEDISNLPLKVQAMNEISDFMILEGQVDMAFAVKQNAIAMIDNTAENMPIKAQMTLSYADSLYDQRRYDEAINAYAQAADYFRQAGDKEKVAYVYNNIGYTYDTLSQCQNAIHYYSKAYTEYKEAQNDDGMINNLSNMGLMYERLGDYNQAAGVYRAQLDLLAKFDETQETAQCAFNVAKCMAAYSDDEDVNRFLNKAYGIFKELGDVENMVACLEFSSLFSYQKGAIPASKSYLNLLLGLLDTKKTHDAKVLIYNTAGSIYFFMGETDKAIDSFFKAIRVRTEQDSFTGIARCYYFMISKIGFDESQYSKPITVNGTTKRIDEFCKESLDFVIKIATSENDLELKADALESRATLMFNLKQFDNILPDIEEGIRCTPDDEQRIGFMIRKSIYFMDIQNDISNALETIRRAISDSGEKQLWDLHCQCLAWECFWILQNDMHNEPALNRLKMLVKNYDYIVAKIPGLLEFMEKCAREMINNKQ
ncbi:MAG: tetratricopeptide repeat protein [Bacteroidales bacterium]|nr:tetratricopeptide repeat protein [Bacteroidales bacterium]